MTEDEFIRSLAQIDDIATRSAFISLHRIVLDHEAQKSHPGVWNEIEAMKLETKPVIEDYKSRTSTYHFLDLTMIKLIGLISTVAVIVGLLDRFLI